MVSLFTEGQDVRWWELIPPSYFITFPVPETSVRLEYRVGVVNDHSPDLKSSIHWGKLEKLEVKG